MANGEYIVKLGQDGLQCEKVLKNTMPVHIASFDFFKVKEFGIIFYVKLLGLKLLM